MEPGATGVATSYPGRVGLNIWLNQLCRLHAPSSCLPSCESVSVSLPTPYPQFSQLVSGDVALLGGGPYVLCTDGQQLLRQVLHPEASRKVCH